MKKYKIQLPKSNALISKDFKKSLYLKVQVSKSVGFYIIEELLMTLWTNMELRDEVVRYIDKRLKPYIK